MQQTTMKLVSPPPGHRTGGTIQKASPSWWGGERDFILYGSSTLMCRRKKSSLSILQLTLGRVALPQTWLQSLPPILPWFLQSLHSLPPSSQVGELLEILKGDTNHLTGINSKKRYFPNVSHRRARDKFQKGLRSFLAFLTLISGESFHALHGSVMN